MKNLFNGGNTASKRWRIALPLMSASAVVASVLILTSGKEANENDVNSLRLAKEELIGEKLQLEKQLAELERKHADAEVLVHDAELRIRELEELSARPQQALRSNAAAASASGNSGNIGRLKRELAGSLDAQDLLRRQLGTAQVDQRKLQEQLDQLRAERDALVARLAQQQTVQMVNNTSVEAVRGKRQQLTTRARRANEIRMAFDLPEHIASNASFQIISPSGKTFEGGGAALSVAPGPEQDEALAARFMLAGGGQERASRVHLHFRPEKRLEAGTYRIDIRSGELYLNTVMLNLR
jgi:hypothetical protein